VKPRHTDATAAGRAGLDALLAEPGTAVVALDYDGTLAPIVQRPEDAVPADGTLDVLARLAARVRRVVIITGRPAPVVVELAGFAHAPRLERLLVLGQYGLQRWEPAGGVEQPAPLPGLDELRRTVTELLAADPGGLRLEDKGHSLVVHARGVPEGAAALDRLSPRIEGVTRASGLETHQGRSVLELRPPGYDKGGALQAVLDEHEARAVLVAGDDVGDLPAFEVVERRRAGGLPGCTVCSDSPEVTALRERADLVVDGPGGVVTLLQQLADEIDGLAGDRSQPW
jgi:trehalose 6-phosphate phosphatase